MQSFRSLHELERVSVQSRRPEIDPYRDAEICSLAPSARDYR